MNNIINFFTTENVIICNILTFPLSIVEFICRFTFIKTIYDLKVSKKNIIFYICIGGILGSFIRLFFPLPYNTIITIILYIILTIIFLKVKIFKSIIAELLVSFTIIIFELITTFIVTKIFLLNTYGGMSKPYLRLLLSLLIYSGMLLISFIIPLFRANLNLSDDMNRKQKIKVLINVLLILLILSPLLILFIKNNMNVPTYYVIYNFISIILFFLLGTYNTHEYNKLDITSRELVTANLYNKTLNKLVDANRAFKHDINNIIQAIGGYLELEDYKRLKVYYNTGLLPEITKVNNLSLLNPETINSPPIFGLLLGKYNYADSKNVKINFKSFFDYTTINMNIFDFVKIFGILLDNAIEAASLCESKIVDIYINIDFYSRKQIFKIENTYINKNINIDDIFKKDYSTKKIKSGFGLWEVKELIKKYTNTNLVTTKTDILFTQKLEIYF